MAKNSKEKEWTRNLIDNFPRWGRPSPGKSLTLQEWLIYIVGGMGAMGATVFLMYLTMTHGLYVAAALQIPVFHITIIGVVTSIIAILTAPLVSWMIDNTNTKFGKFRPYLIVMPIPIVLCFFALGQVIKIPDYTTMIIVYTILFNAMFFMNRVYMLAFSSLAQVMAPSVEERTQLMSIGTFFTSLGPTIANFAYPFVANALYSYSIPGTKPNPETGIIDDIVIAGVNTLGASAWLVPLFAMIFFALGLVMAFGVKERMVVSKKFKQKQKFTDGCRKVAGNKYFWLFNTSNMIGALKGLSLGFGLWFINYVIFPELVADGYADAAKLVQSVAVMFIADACVPGMLFAPWLIKKFGKKKISIVTNIGMGLFAFPLIFVTNAWVGLVLIFGMTFFGGFQIVTNLAFQAEVNDYQQYKTGDRIEGFLSQSGYIMLTAIGVGTAFIAPAVYTANGYLDNANVLQDPSVLWPIVSTLSILAVISCVLCAIPFFFWDMTEKRHSDIMEILKTRVLFEDEVIDEPTKDMLELAIEGGNNDALKTYMLDNGLGEQLDSVDDDNQDETTKTICENTKFSAPQVNTGAPFINDQTSEVIEPIELLSDDKSHEKDDVDESEHID